MGKYVGFEHGKNSYKQIIEFEGDVENLAAFIVSRDFRTEYTVTDGFDNLVLTTNGKFVQTCPDKNFLQNELLPVLITYQKGLYQTGVVQSPDLRVIKQEHLEAPEVEDVNELEM
jgi:hypothetical protein